MRRPVIVSTSLAFAVVLLGASPPARGPGDQEVAAAAAASPAPAPPEVRSPRNASYVIDARLDVKTHLLSATEEITWRNITAHAASEVRLHLYFNAWANDKTSYALANRLGPIPWSLLLMDHRRDDWGYCDIKSLTILPPPANPGRKSCRRPSSSSRTTATSTTARCCGWRSLKRFRPAAWSA